MAHETRIAEVFDHPESAGGDRVFMAVGDPSDETVYKIMDDDAFGMFPGGVFRGGYFQAVDEIADGTVYVLVNHANSANNRLGDPTVVRVLQAIADRDGVYDDLINQENDTVGENGKDDEDEDEAGNGCPAIAGGRAEDELIFSMSLPNATMEGSQPLNVGKNIQKELVAVKMHKPVPDVAKSQHQPTFKLHSCGDTSDEAEESESGSD